jgi:hypothetical protein
MSHFAKLDSNNIVENIIVAEKDFINSGVVGDEFLWVQTSYNGSFRGEFAEIGGTYDRDLNCFLRIKPFPSWILDDEMNWRAPIDRPDETILADNEYYTWEETAGSWVITTCSESIIYNKS